eukprot:15431873-Alexandrium_andersonii.AAC.1
MTTPSRESGAEVIEALREQVINGKTIYGYRIPNPFSADADRGATLGVDNQGFFTDPATRAAYRRE